MKISHRNGKLSHARDVCISLLVSKRMKAYEADCTRHNKSTVMLQSENNHFLHFVNYKNEELVPAVFYADLECLIEQRKESQNERIVSNHKVFSIGFCVMYAYNFKSLKSEYVG